MVKSASAKSEKSLVKQMMVKKTKKEEYQGVCQEINSRVKIDGETSKAVKDAYAIIQHFASVSENQSYKLLQGATTDIEMERVKEILTILDTKNRRCNGSEAKIEGAVKLMVAGAIKKLCEEEEKVQDAKKSLVMNLMRHCVNLSSKNSSNLDLQPLRDLFKARYDKLSSEQTSVEDAQMDELAGVFSQTSL